MTAEQLEELLGKVTQGAWVAYNQLGDWGLMGAWYVAQEGHDPHVPIAMVEYETPYCLGASKRSIDAAARACANATLIAIAPSLARRVIAAEKLVNVLAELPLGDGPLAQLVTAYQEAAQ